jgi:hypothetical protein
MVREAAYRRAMWIACTSILTALRTHAASMREGEVDGYLVWAMRLSPPLWRPSDRANLRCLAASRACRYRKEEVMAGVVHHIGEGQGSLLATITLRRRADGRIIATLEDMPIHEIENESTISARFTKAAMWAFDGVIDLMRQAVIFDDESRAANEGGTDNG